MEERVQIFEMEKYFPLIKVDETNHTAYGIATCEKPDKEEEICDYTGAKKAYQVWSKEAEESTTAAGQAISLGNIRLMHRSVMAGKAVKIKFDDDRKQIWVESTPAPPISKEDPDIWPLLRDGFLRGYSQGGKYASRVCNECRKDISGHFCSHCNKKVLVRYIPVISEVSYVDNPALKEAAFTLVKSDGSTEVKKFSSTPQLPTGNAGEIPSSPTPVKEGVDGGTIMAGKCSCKCEQCAKGECTNCSAEEKCASCKAAKTVKVSTAKVTLEGVDETNKAVKYLVTSKGEKHLPYTKEDGKPDHRLMGAAWAALHDGFRGNKYAGPDKAGAIKRLKQVYAREALDTPTEKAEMFDGLMKGILEDVIQNRAFGCMGKGLYTVSRFSEVVENLKYLYLSLEYERETEGDESPVTDDTKEILNDLLDALLDYTEEQILEERERIHEKAAV